MAFDHENGNIPKSSILALANVSGTIFGSASVGERFKTYVLEMLLRCVENLRQFDHMHDYADLLLEAVARGQLSRPTAAWAHKLEALVDKVDLLLRMGVGQSLVKKSHELAS